MSEILRNPYRPFFLVGTFAAALGVCVWIPFGLGWWDLYPGTLHAQTMMGLFLNCFVSGFLMTAIPRMSGTRLADPRELRLQALGLSVVAAVVLSPLPASAFFAASVLSLGILLRFCGRRIVQRTSALPEIFAFVLFGLLSGVGGALLSLAGQEILGARLFYLNFVLCLVLGIGMRLVPVLLRLEPKKTPLRTTETLGLAALLTACCFLETFHSPIAGVALRALVGSWIIGVRWRVFRRAGDGAGLRWGVRIAALSMLAGLWFEVASPEHRLEWIHLVYVSGFSLMTIMVASRVILAHGGHDLGSEVGNWHVRLPVFLFLLAGATRAAAPFISGEYERHLAYAALVYLLALGVWARFFLPRIFPREATPSTVSNFR